MKAYFDEFGIARAEGRSRRTLPEIVAERRSTVHFKPDPVDEEDLAEILRLAAQAPSSVKLQPWRFIVVRNAENRRRLQRHAMDQGRISEAPVVIIAVGIREQWKDLAEEIVRQGAIESRGVDRSFAEARRMALDVLSTLPLNLWVNRQTMIAFATLMLAAETMGYDTAPMEGFDPEAVKREFNIPEDGEVVALLAIGRALEPVEPKRSAQALDRIVFEERFGKRWHKVNEQPDHEPERISSKNGGRQQSSVKCCGEG